MEMKMKHHNHQIQMDDSKMVRNIVSLRWMKLKMEDMVVLTHEK